MSIFDSFGGFDLYNYNETSLPEQFYGLVSLFSGTDELTNATANALAQGSPTVVLKGGCLHSFFFFFFIPQAIRSAPPAVKE